MKPTFFHAPKSTLEIIDDELRPLESTFHTMLKQSSLKPETRKKIEQNIETLSHFRIKTTKNHCTVQSKSHKTLLSL